MALGKWGLATVLYGCQSTYDVTYRYCKKIFRKYFIGSFSSLFPKVKSELSAFSFSLLYGIIIITIICSRNKRQKAHQKT